VKTPDAPDDEPSTSGNGNGTRASAATDEQQNQQQHPQPIAAFYGALSRRDLAALRDLLHPDVTYENLAVAGTSGASALRGSDAVVAFFADALSGVERGAAFEVDDWALQQQGQQERSAMSVEANGRAAAVWRLVSPSAAGAGAAGAAATTTTTLARGVSFFRLSADGQRVEGVVDAPEHAVKTPRAGLAMAAPLAPAVQLLSESLASSLDALAAAAFGGGNGGSAGGSAAGASAAASAAASMAAAAAAAWAAPPASSSNNGASAQQPQPPEPVPTSNAGAGAGAEAATTQPLPPLPPPLEPLDPRLALAGLWQRDPNRTDMASLDASLELMGLGRLQRLTARLIDGVQVDVSPSTEQLTVAFLTSVPVFRVTERVPLLPAAAASDAEPPSSQEQWWASELSGPRAARLARRDLRPGRASAVARRRRPVASNAASSQQQEQPVLEVRTQWGAPVAGALRETYSVVVGGGGDASSAGAPDQVVVTAVTEVGGRSVTSRAVYVRARAGATAEDLLAEGRRRSGGGLGEALRRQGL
jgi:hypothetical protein